MCESVPKSDGSLFSAWSINATAVNAWRLFRKIHGNNVPLLKFLRELLLETLRKYGRNRPAQSLNTSRIAGANIKLDTLNHVVARGESKYCRCQQFERRTIFKCEKCKVSLQPECMKPHHQETSTRSLYAILYLYKAHCDKINIYTLHIKHIFTDPCFCEIHNFWPR